MNKKKTAVIVSVILFVAAAVTAVIVFRRRIGDFLEKLKGSVKEPEPEFTPEEMEAFADI